MNKKKRRRIYKERLNFYVMVFTDHLIVIITGKIKYKKNNFLLRFSRVEVSVAPLKYSVVLLSSLYFYFYFFLLFKK
jgi:hypothetical protein